MTTKTVLITGASSGIGLEFAHIFAQNKINLVLVARNHEKLKTLAEELEAKHKVNVSVLPFDLSNYQNAEAIFKWLEAQKISIQYLINNAGFGELGSFADSKWARQEQMINLNITALTYLTHLFLPAMRQAGYGRILNVASTAAFQPGPGMAVYFATKSFVLHFSEAINAELSGSGVTVTALCPGATESGFADAAKASESKLFKGRKLPSSREVAVYGYKAMMKGKAVAVHGLVNKSLIVGIRLMPRKLVVQVSKMIMS